MTQRHPVRASCVHADATDSHAYEKALAKERAQLLLTDPPYCLLTRRRKKGDLRDPKGRKIDRDPVVRFENVREYRNFTQGWLEAALPYVRRERPVVIWTNFLGKAPILEALSQRGYSHPWGEFIWAKKTQAGNSGEQLLRAYEVALVVGSHAPPEPATDAPPVPWSFVSGYDDDGQGDVWGAHPHHKPFGVLEPLLRAYSAPGDLVLDPFAGSGSIAEAAVKLGRSSLCFEKKADWAARVAARLKPTVGDSKSPALPPR